MVLWGDSHAASLYPGLKALQGPDIRFRVAQFTMGACPPVLGWQSDKRPTCKAFNDATLQQLQTLKPDVVLLEADWLIYFGAGISGAPEQSALQRTLDQVGSIGVPRVVVFGNLPVWRTAQPKVSVKLWLDTHTLPERTAAYLDSAAARADAAVGAAVSGTGAVFVSPIAKLCDERGCLLTTDHDRWTPVAWDAAHLTAAGSAYLIRRSAGEILGSFAGVLTAGAMTDRG